MSPALGRKGRYSMTPHQQRLYVGLVASGDRMFRHRDAMAITGLSRGPTHRLIHSLVERGWAAHSGHHYALTPPVMNFRLCREVEAS